MPRRIWIKKQIDLKLESSKPCEIPKLLLLSKFAPHFCFIFIKNSFLN